MAFQFVLLAATLAVANAGVIGGPALGYAAAPAVGYAAAAPVAYASPAIGATHESTVRSLDGNSAVTTYSKAVDSAFSSVRKYDSRASNDAQILAHAPVAHYAAPVAHAYAAPVAHAYAAPVAHAYAAPAYAAAPVAHHYATPVAHTYAAAPVAHHYATAPVGYAGYAAAPAVAKAGLLGVAYSPASIVSHMTYTSGPITYAY